jgi:hypothetical protein
MPGKLGSVEPLLADERVEKLAAELKKRLPGLPPDSMVVTYVVPKKDGQGPWAVLGVVSKGPEAHQNPFMTQGSVFLETFEERERQSKHFVGVTDPALSILLIVAGSHIEKYEAMTGMLPN